MKKKIPLSAFLLVIGLMSAKAGDLRHLQGHRTPVARNVLSTELPATLYSDIKNEYKDFWIAELYEVKDKRHPSFFITLENADQVIKLNAINSKNWVMTSTTIKES
jgi:hypothetical protein